MLPRYLSTRIVFDPNEIFRIEYRLQSRFRSLAIRLSLLNKLNYYRFLTLLLVEFVNCCNSFRAEKNSGKKEKSTNIVIVLPSSLNL